MTQYKSDTDNDIPVLDDLVLMDGPDDDLPKSGVRTQHQQQQASPAAASTQAAEPSRDEQAQRDEQVQKINYEMPLNSKPVPRDNPFLPYEHLEQLARERVEFQRQFSEFTLSQQAYRPNFGTVQEPRMNYGVPAATPQQSSAHTDTSIENLARQLTHEVMNELRPQVERRIRELLDERLADFSSQDRSRG